MTALYSIIFIYVYIKKNPVLNYFHVTKLNSDQVIIKNNNNILALKEAI